MIGEEAKGQGRGHCGARRHRKRVVRIGVVTLTAAAVAMAVSPGSAAAEGNADGNILNKQDVAPAMKSVAPLLPSAHVDGYPTLDSDSRNWFLDVGEGEAKRTPEQNKAIEGDLSGLGGTVEKRVMDPMIMKDKCTSTARCGFVGALQSDSEYPAVVTGDTASGSPIRFDKSTSVSKSDSFSSGYKVGLAASGGTDVANNIKGNFEVNVEKSSTLSLTDSVLTSNTYDNSAKRPVYIEARANAGWYTGYILITEPNNVTTAIPARVLVASSATKSPVTWNAVYADSQ